MKAGNLLKRFLPQTMPLAYGPVDSRRFGKSLGVNCLGAEKACSFDCRYCDLGPSLMTMNRIRKELQFPSRSDIVAAVRAQLRLENHGIKAITFSGNGEPTLYPEFDELVADIKIARNELTSNAKLVVLSNGAHLDSKKVITGMNEVDIRVIKLDAGNDKNVKLLNAPLVRRNLAQLLSGTKKLKDCVIQSMFVKGSFDNTQTQDIEDWVEMVGMIRPAGVQLMTITREPADRALLPVEEDVLYSIAFKLKKRTQLEAQVFGS